MVGMMLEHDFMIQKSICDTFVLRKRGFSGSDQMLLNTLSGWGSIGEDRVNRSKADTDSVAAITTLAFARTVPLRA